MVNQVQVIQHQVQGLKPGLQEVDQLTDESAVGRRHTVRQGIGFNSRLPAGLAQGAQQITAKGQGRIVLLVQAEPGHPMTLLAQNLRPLPQ